MSPESPAKAGDGGERLAPVTHLSAARARRPHSDERQSDVPQSDEHWVVPGIGAGAGAGARVWAHPAASEGGVAVDSAAGDGVAERQERRARNVSLAGLGRRDMSRWEIERLLRSRDLDEAAIAQEMERLESSGLIDDHALAEHIVQTRHERKGLGRQAIVAELRRRHIDQETIDAALVGLDRDDEREVAFTLAEKRAQQLASYDHATASRRLSGFLQRKGYDASLVRDAVEHGLGGRRRGHPTVWFE